MSIFGGSLDRQRVHRLCSGPRVDSIRWDRRFPNRQRHEIDVYPGLLVSPCRNFSTRCLIIGTRCSIAKGQPSFPPNELIRKAIAHLRPRAVCLCCHRRRNRGTRWHLPRQVGPICTLYFRDPQPLMQTLFKRRVPPFNRVTDAPSIQLPQSRRIACCIRRRRCRLPEIGRTYSGSRPLRRSLDWLRCIKHDPQICLATRPRASVSVVVAIRQQRGHAQHQSDRQRTNFRSPMVDISLDDGSLCCFMFHSVSLGFTRSHHTCIEAKRAVSVGEQW